MAFLRNRAVNWLNLHSGIHALANGMGGVFVLVFLLRAGISIPASLCAMALIVAARRCQQCVGRRPKLRVAPLLGHG